MDTKSSKSHGETFPCVQLHVRKNGTRKEEGNQRGGHLGGKRKGRGALEKKMDGGISILERKERKEKIAIGRT